MSEADIIYVGAFRFPAGDAGGSRVRGICFALRDAGYTVAVAGNEDLPAPGDVVSDGRACHAGIDYYPAKNLDSLKFARLRRGIYHHATGAAALDRLDRIVGPKTKAVVVYNGTSPLIGRLLRFCRKRGITLIADCTEWFDGHHVPGGFWGPFHADSELRMRWLQPKIGNLIVISSFLERYYRNRGCNVLRIPPLVDLQMPIWRPVDDTVRENSEMQLSYSGTPGKKDFMVNALRGCLRLRADKFPFKVHLIGTTREGLRNWLKNDPGFVDELGDAVIYHGRVPQTRAIELTHSADFTILLREDKRYAHAGFSTKFVESLSAGVPVIANPTSDIGEYLRDGHEGVLLENHSPEAFAAGVRRLFEMPCSRWREMRFHARRRAEECFDYRRYIPPLKDFIEGLPAPQKGSRNHG